MVTSDTRGYTDSVTVGKLFNPRAFASLCIKFEVIIIPTSLDGYALNKICETLSSVAGRW